ncbi:glycosyltransferase family 8 protein [Schizophyllum commune Loenen D]|nr:glycosyltransferase family 8 protein [Schizophyllum commune Loenen D]
MSSSDESSQPLESAPSLTRLDYDFTPTQDWFSGNVERWRGLFPLVTASAPRVLEIGTWEGRSSVFLLEELCKDAGELVTIDHYDLLQTEAGRARRARVEHNLRLAGGRSRIIEAFSVPGLMTVLRDETEAVAAAAGFDWLYVDGSHRADDTFLDGELVWRLARKAAIIIFDDYRWPAESPGSMLHPRRGIDAFLELHAGEFERLSGESDYQMVVQKKTEMRIGWAYAEGSSATVESALDYGINLAFAVNNAYAMPATAAISSALRALSPGARCTVYVLDCGMSKEDKEKISAVIDKDGGERTSIVFLEPAEDDLCRTLNSATWAKLDIVRRVPAERVLYLDADVLVLGDLSELWNTDLQGKAIGAAPDVGYPKGHPGVDLTKMHSNHASLPGDGVSATEAQDTSDSPAYFNAGVLLMDLAKMRSSAADIARLAPSASDLHFKDQDVLNMHFAGDWTELSLKYNAQGLGTYADIATSERKLLSLDEMCNSPVIVHFTGPVHPSLVKVLNTWVQPYTAKPWGYAGSPGHPFADVWWEVLERTAHAMKPRSRGR